MVLIAIVLVGVVIWGIATKLEQLREEKRFKEYLKELNALKAKMTLEKRDSWSLEDIALYDGKDTERPILIAANGRVFNVWRGREFYGENAPYHCFAGQEITRMLAKELLESEADDEKVKPLSAFEKMMLNDWVETYQFKYDDLGPLEGWEDGLRQQAFDGIAVAEPVEESTAEPKVSETDGFNEVSSMH